MIKIFDNYIYERSFMIMTDHILIYKNNKTSHCKCVKKENSLHYNKLLQITYKYFITCLK